MKILISLWNPLQVELMVSVDNRWVCSDDVFGLFVLEIVSVKCFSKSSFWIVTGFLFSGTGNPHGGRDGEGPSGIKKFEECQQYMDSAHGVYP